LLYEVPYICVPTLLEKDMVEDKEYEKIVETATEDVIKKRIEAIRIKVGTEYVGEAQYEGFKKIIEKAL
jgi:hypothetical protein